MPAVCGGVSSDAIADDVEVLARALAHEPARVEQDRLLIAGLRVASIFASTLLRYWPEALACGISESCGIRRQLETFARMPLALPSSPRYAPHGHTAIETSTGASSGYSPIWP